MICIKALLIFENQNYLNQNYRDREIDHRKFFNSLFYLKPNSILVAMAKKDESSAEYIRSVFSAQKRNEIFIQSSPDLARATATYQEKIFLPKEERRRVRLNERMRKLNITSIASIPDSELREFGRKGFPSEYRCAAYEHLLRISDFQAKYGDGYFEKCLSTDIPLSVGRVIQVDLPRTLSSFTSSCDFKTKEILMKMLRDILWAFAVHKPEIGYCQSLNFIAAFFLSIFGDAKKSFYALVQLVDSPTSPYIGLHIPGYYAPGMTQLLSDISVLELMCRSRIGERGYRKFFEKREISNLSMIVSEWFHTLFITVFPIRTVERIMDYIVSNCGGANKVIFRLAFTIIVELVERKNELVDLDELMRGHKRITRSWIDHNALINSATRGLRLFSKKDLEKWRKKDDIRRSGQMSVGVQQPVGNTMMKLEEAIAPQTTRVLSVPEDSELVISSN